MRITLDVLEEFLKEDHAQSDSLAKLLYNSKQEITVSFIAKATGVVSGVETAMSMMKNSAPTIRYNIVKESQKHVNRGDVIASVKGKVVDILRTYRVALNIIERMSGIASSANKYVLELRNTDSIVVSRRSLTPSIRELEVKAINDGGASLFGDNLNDIMILSKEHLALYDSITNACEIIDSKNKLNNPYWIEVEDLDEFYEASLSSCYGIIMINFNHDMIDEALELNINGKILALDNKNITVANIRSYALKNIKYIFVPCTTLGYKALDVEFKALQRLKKVK